jgi:hypothetical protein
MAVQQAKRRDVEGASLADYFSMIEKRRVALVIFVVTGSVIVVFWQQVFGLANFIGDSDRLNSYLNIRLAEYDSLKQYGRMVGWDNHLFAGMSLAALHWMNVGADPVAWLLQLFERDQIYQVLGYVSICSILAACIAAYAYLRDVVGPGTLAAVGAVCYGLSVFSIHRMAQVDNAHLTVVAIPAALLAVRRIRPDNLFWPFLALCAILIALAHWGFLQEAGYAYLFFGIYALYRTAIFRRDGWMAAAAPFAIFAMASVVSLLFSSPRLLTVATDFFQLVRSDRINYTGFGQFVRFFHEGIYGRYFEEGLLLQNALNLNEGLQLVSSVTLILVVCHAILHPTTGAKRVIALVFSAMILALWRPEFLTRVLTEHVEIGISETMLFILFYAALLGAGACVFAWAVKLPVLAALRSAPAMDTRPLDTSFHLFAVVVLLLLVLTPEGYGIVHLLFGRADFTHTRLSVLLVLPLCTLFCIHVFALTSPSSGQGSVFVHEEPRLKLVAVVVGGLVAWLVHGPLIDRLVPLNAFELWPYDHFRAVPGVAIKMLITAGILGVSLLFCYRPIKSRDARPIVACLVASFALVETVSYAAFKVGGPQTWSYPVAFRNFNYLNVPTSVLRPPTEPRLAKVAADLEVEKYRSVLLSDPRGYRVAKSSHIGEFWQIRLIGGYGTGIPRRLAELPWSDKTQWLREIELTSISDADFQLLALLNVKYVLLLSPDLYFNVPSGAAGNVQRKIRSLEGATYTAEVVTVDGISFGALRNPVEALPRHFLAGSVTGVSQTPQVRLGLTSANNPGAPIISDIGRLREHSFAEKLSGTQTFDAGGDLAVTYQGDAIDIWVSPSIQRRFVVVNERYHPDWRARSGRSELSVLPTNAVMMGIVVPAGVDHVQLQFEPISARAHVLTVFAFVMIVLMAGGLRLVEARASNSSDRQFRSDQARK